MGRCCVGLVALAIGIGLVLQRAAAAWAALVMLAPRVSAATVWSRSIPTHGGLRVIFKVMAITSMPVHQRAAAARSPHVIRAGPPWSASDLLR